MSRGFSLVSGVALCVVVAAVSVFFSSYVPLGAVAISILIGIVVGNVLKPGRVLSAGIRFSEKHILSFAIALMGVNLNFLFLKSLGAKSLFLIIAAISVTIMTSLLLSRIFKFDKKFALLLGIGNGVCGSSAIAATEGIIGANEEEVGLSVAVVNFLGTIGIFLVPFVATVILKLSDINSGILVGNTLQAVGQVVAAGFSIGPDTGQTAVLVKMTRILMLFPLVFILIIIFAGKSGGLEGKPKRLPVPVFIIGFVLFSMVPTFGLLSERWIGIIGRISHYSLVVAMAGIGLKITIQDILKDGKTALLMGSLIFFVQILFSSTVILFMFKAPGHSLP